MPQSGATQFKTLNASQVEVMATPIISSAGVGSAGQVMAPGANGKIDPSFFPTGLGADVYNIPATEALSAGAFVNIYNASGTESARNADQTAANGGKPATGFVLTAVTAGAMAAVYLNGVNTAVTGQTPGPVFLGATGAATSAAPAASGVTLQNIGDAVTATAIHFQRGPVTIL